MKKAKQPVTYETRYKHKLNMLELFSCFFSFCLPLKRIRRMLNDGGIFITEQVGAENDLKKEKSRAATAGC